MSNAFPYTDADYTVVTVPEQTTDGGWVISAYYLELPGCESQGDTEDEARENLKDAFALYVNDMLERGLEVPPPARDNTIRVKEIRIHLPTAQMSHTGALPLIIKPDSDEPEATTGFKPEVVGSR